MADLPRVAAILQRNAAGVDELARARRVADLGAAAAFPDRRAERRRRVAEPDLDFREFCRRSKVPQSERSWDLFAAERYQRGETDIPSYETYNPFRHRQRDRMRDSCPCRGVQQTGHRRVLMARLLPASRVWAFAASSHLVLAHHPDLLAEVSGPWHMARPAHPVLPCGRGYS
jgi:hypothetical protein